MRQKGPTNASSSIYSRNGSLNPVPSVHPHPNSLLFIYKKKKHFQKLENQFGKVERMQVF